MSESNIVALPANGYAPNNVSVAQSLRDLADRIENNKMDVRSVVSVVEDNDGDICLDVIGNRMDYARLVGVLWFAQQKAGTER